MLYLCLPETSANEGITDDPTNNVDENAEKSDLSQKDLNTRSNEKAFLNRLEKKKQQLSYVTEDNLGQFQLNDVEMIVPGHGIPYPRVSLAPSILIIFHTVILLTVYKSQFNHSLNSI